jgi:DUF1680 family protein
VLDWHLEDGTPLKIQQKTNYPWDGDVELTVAPSEPHEFTLYVRIPSWAHGASASVNGKPQTGVKAGEYLAIRRTWAAGDAVKLGFPMSTEAIASNPRVAENRGRVAVRRGPIIYCMEELDQPTGVTFADVSLDLSPRGGTEFQHDYKAEMLDGIVVLHHRGGVLESASADEALYGPANLAAPKTRLTDISLIPYYVWANRQSCAMQVWVPYIRT